MRLSVLANLYGAKTLDETLKILSGLGVHTVEIGAGLRKAVSFLQDIIIVEEKPTTMSWA